jgi:hypothetical protein
MIKNNQSKWLLVKGKKLWDKHLLFPFDLDIVRELCYRGIKQVYEISGIDGV